MSAAPAALPRTPGQAALRRFRGDRPAMFGLYLVIALALFAIFGPLLAPSGPFTSDFSMVRDRFGAPPGPSAAHWLGTDPLFRDIYARLAHGARLSLAIAALATLLATTVGALVGVTAGWLAGTRLDLVDVVLMRIVDVLLALPFLLFVTAIGVAVGRADVGTILLVLGLTGWTGTARIVRAKTLQIRELDFVVAARAMGAGPLRIVRRHVLPNVTGTLIVLATASVAQMILAEAVLGYLTVGVQPPRPSWGRMLHEAEPYLGARLSLVAAPGFAILLAVLGFNRVGEGLRDALDPRGVSLPRAARLPSDLLIAAAALLLVAVASPNHLRPPLGASTASGAEPTRGGWLRVATFVNVRTLEPALAYEEGAGMIDQLVFDRLVDWNDEGEIVPELASAFELSPDGKTYTFTLRGGVRFHDGAELGADDVKRSIERTLDPRTPSPAAGLYEAIVGFEEFHAGKAPHLDGVRVLGPRSLSIELREPDATFLALLTMTFAAPVCPSSGATVDPRSPVVPCGSGPFRVERSDAESGFVLVRHEAYWRPGRPYLDGIEWGTNVRPSTQRYKLEAGEQDFCTDLVPTDIALFEADPAWAGRGRWISKQANNAIFMNTEIAPFDDRSVRRAVAFAVDPSVLAKVRPDILPIDRVLPDSIPGPDRRVPMRRHDLAAALAEMAKAGYPFDPATGRGGYPREIDYLTVPDSFEQSSAEIYQQQLARIGIRVRLHLVTFATYLAEVSRRGGAAMGWTGWHADFPDPSNFFEPTLSSKAIQDEGSQNRAFFSSAELEDVLVRAHAERDRARRMSLYERAEEIVRDEAPWAPTYVARSYQVWQPYLHGYEPHPFLPQRFGEVWLDPPATRLARSTGARRALGLLAPFGFGGDTPHPGGPR